MTRLQSVFTLCILLLSVSVLAQTKQLSIKDFITHGDFLNMELSPDGKHIAARARADGKVNLVILDSKTVKIVGGVTPQNNDSIHSVRWVSNERLVYEYAEKTSRLDAPTPTGELFATNIDGSRHTMLFGYRAGQQQTGSNIRKRKATKASADILSLMEGDDDEILIVEYPWTLVGNTYYDKRDKPPVVTRLNIFTGKKRKVEVLPYNGARAFATAKGEVLFIRWTSTDFNSRAAYRTDIDSPWITMDESDGKFLPVGLSKDGKKVYLTSTVGEKGVTNLFELEMASGIRKPLFSNLDADISNINWDLQSDMPAVAMSYPGNVQYHYLDEPNRTAKFHKALVKAFGGQDLNIESQSEDGELILVRVSSSINPGEYYLFNTKTSGADFLWANRSWLDPRDMSEKQVISFKSVDDLQVNGYLTMPAASNAAKKAPMIVLIHGGPHARVLNNFDWEVQLLASKGYAVLQVNFRGSTGYGQRFEHAGYREWGRGMINDIISGTQFAIDNYSVDSTRVCAYGASYGGYAALMASAIAPELYKCTVGYVGVYDLNLMYTEGNISQRLYYGRAYLEKTIGTDKAELDAFSPVNLADKIKSNVMLIHGEKDTQVPAIHSERMLEKLEAADKEVPYLNFSKSGHGVYDEKGRMQLYTALLEFFDENTAK